MASWSSRATGLMTRIGRIWCKLCRESSALLSMLSSLVKCGLRATRRQVTTTSISTNSQKMIASQDTMLPLRSNFSNLILMTDEAAEQYAILSEQQGLQHGTNLSISPCTGNAVLVLNSSQHWTHPLLEQNTSSGIHLDKSDYLWDIPALRTAFSSFDYRYWMMAGEAGYDFNNSKVSGTAQWDPVTWMCDTSTVMSGGSCASSSTSKFTSMLTAAEWAQFAVTRKALRVSRPRRGQRSTYWLQLPWKYSLPLLAVSIFLS